MSPAWRLYRQDQVFAAIGIIATITYVFFVDVWKGVEVALVIWLIVVWIVGHLIDQVEEESYPRWKQSA